VHNGVFREALASIRDKVAGTLAVSLISLDGIPIETINADSVPLDVIGAEFGGFIKSVRLFTEKYITLLSAVTPEYFLLLVMQPDGNYGRARHELARAKHTLRDELV